MRYINIFYKIAAIVLSSFSALHILAGEYELAARSLIAATIVFLLELLTAA